MAAYSCLHTASQPMEPTFSTRGESATATKRVSLGATLRSTDTWDTFNNAVDDKLSSLSRSREEAPINPRINNTEDLRNGIVTTQKNRTKEYTILIVGETGTGKTTLLSLFFNILVGNGIREYMLAHDESNDTGNAQNQSQTISALLYEFESRNGVKLRILDTPGLVDTRGIEQDNLHKASIARTIREHVTTVNAVLLLTNGTVERLGVATDYALSTLSSIFPRSLADNIGVMFTCVPDIMSWNFDLQSLPSVLRDMEGNRFLIDNPVAKWQRLVALTRSNRITRSQLVEMRRKLEECHTGALSVLAILFDWLDTLTPQPTSAIMQLYDRYQEIERGIANALSRASQVSEQKAELKRMQMLAENHRITMEQYLSVVVTKTWERVNTVQYNTICRHPGCRSNCCVGCKLPFSLNPLVMEACSAMANSNCKRRGCRHPMNEHYHDRSMWKKRERGQEVIREGLEQQYSDARQQNDENERKIVDLGEKIAELDKEMEEHYAHLSLTGSFIGQVKTTIRFLETNLEMINQNGEADPRLIERVEKTLDEMNQKLKVLRQLDPENDAENDGANGKTGEGTGGGSGGRTDGRTGEGVGGGSGGGWRFLGSGWRVWRRNDQGNKGENQGTIKNGQSRLSTAFKRKPATLEDLKKHQPS
ncbi:hypothetical protein F5887DRAFT_1164318 [Amanita rubescens]|nr:hypothetical protein F5887DRAFT_1164318 [Amanita rubescens]